MRFVFDLDGTLCFDGRSIAPEIQEALAKAPEFGHQLVFASARSYRDCIPVLGEKLAQEMIIALNGGLAYEDGKVIFHGHLDERGFKEALSWCDEYNLPYLIDDDFDYCGSQIEKLPFFEQIDSLQLAKRLELSDLKNPIKMVIGMSQHEELVDDILHELRLLDSMDVTYHEEEKCLYLNPYGTNKANTVTNLIGTDFVVFGDGKNDLGLFQESLYSVQVGDSVPLEKYADEQVPADSSAIAQKIQKLYEEF